MEEAKIGTKEAAALASLEERMKPDVRQETMEEREQKMEVSDDRVSQPTETRVRDPIHSVCSSSTLDDFLVSKRNLNVSYPVPRSGSLDFVSEATTEMPIIELEPQVFGIMAGLGIKRKGTGMKDAKNAPSKKPKTLSEKRVALEAEILKYGLATVEKMYPRQPPQSQMKYFAQRRLSSQKLSPKGSPIKMKPKPSGLDFEEVDARQILKPLSHDKYIREPAYDSVVYITRRNGIVPLSSLCKDSNTILSSNVRLLQGRNVRLGKPNVFLKDKDRLLALGGSRNKHPHSINIVKIPKLIQDRREKCIPFEMDNEYALFAVEALVAPSKKSAKVDIRTLKKQKKAEQSHSVCNNSPLLGKGIINHVFDKLKKANEMENTFVDESESDKDSKEEDGSNEITKNDQLRCVSPVDRELQVKSQIVEAEDDKNNVLDEADETIKNDTQEQGEQTIHNSWTASKELVPAPLPDIENKPILTDEFKKKFEERKKNPVAGADVCDVEDCFCKELDDTTSTFPTELQTPVSGSQTPSTTAQRESLGKDSVRKTKNNLSKVRRALKSLGVTVYEFDDSIEKRTGECTKEFCRLGCVCETIASKPVPPTHCGKVECMLKCFCSEDAVKFASSRKVGISPAGAANLRSSSQRHMAAEERKFHNTVVATTSGQDLMMLGSSGRQKRERKVPSRYQDSDTLMLEAGGKDYVGKASGGDIDDYIGTDPTVAKLIDEGLRDNTMKKCAVVVPLIELPPDTNPWCMFHCQYSCPCSKLKNPLDYAPDKNVSRKPDQAIGMTSENSETMQVKKNERKDIAPHERPGPKSSKLKSKDVVMKHCARTAGLLIKPSNKVKMPYKIVQSIRNKSAKAINENDSEIRSATSFANQKGKENNQERNPDAHIRMAGIRPATAGNTVAPKENRPGFGLITGVSTITPNSKFLGNFLEDTPPLNLSMQPKGSIQYARWNVLKQDLQEDKITAYCFLKSSRYVVFVARAKESPYVTSAENIKTLDPSRYKSLPPTVESLLSESSEGDLSRYAILTHNGIAWELTGVLQKKKPTEDAKKRLPKRNEDRKEDAIASSHQQLNPAVVISQDTAVMKLPLGQSLVTMQRQGPQGLQTMQIKLPTTTGTQHWCTIRVDNAEGTIQCPDSTMALKCIVLKQAATLSMKEETTVRIPIAVPGEVSSFGVYAVPGLSSHVFVGPFSNKPKVEDSEVICLDSPPTKDAEDEEVQVITPAASNGNLHRRKQRLEKRIDNAELAAAKDEIVEKLVKDISDHAVSVGERKIRQEAYRSRLVTGQMPLVVENLDNDDVILIDSSEDEGTDQSDQSKSTFEMNYPKVPYLNMNTSDYGKVVIRTKSKTVPSNQEQNVVSLGKTNIIVTKKPNGVVTFPHPKLPDHEVFCGTLEDATKWVQEYEESESRKENQHKEAITFNKSADQPPFQLQLKPISSLIASESSCGRIVKRTQEIIHPDGRKGLAIFLDRQHQQELTKLYYNLGNEAFEHCFRKNISRIQILQKAKDEAVYLCQQDKELQQIKKSLMLKRKKLFEHFTNALKGLPIEVKKQKLQELKNVVKKRDDLSQEPRKKAENILLNSEPLSQAHSETGSARQSFMPNTINSKHSQLSKTLSIPSNLPILSPSHQSSSSAGGPTPYSDVTGLKTVKKDGKVLRPMNAFMLWAKDHRRTLIANGYDGATVSKMLAEEWKVLTDDQKQKYYHEAENLKGLHQLQHPNYKYSPRARKNTKRGAKTSTSSLSVTHIQPKRIAPAPSGGFSTSGVHTVHNSALTLGSPIRIPQAPTSFLQQTLVVPSMQTMTVQSSDSFQAPMTSNVRPEIETIAID